MAEEDIIYSSDFLYDVEIVVSYLINIPEQGILETKEVEKLEWSALPDKIVKHKDWYFKYRAALFQVKYPKYTVEIKKSTTDQKSVLQQKNILEKRISAKKRKITEMKNKVDYVKSNWNELFPVEDYPIYKKFISNMNTKMNELIQLEKELNLLNKTSDDSKETKIRYRR